MKYDGIIFDLDGTLWDSTNTLAESWSISLSSEGEGHVFTALDIAGIMGCTDREIQDKLFSRFGDRAHELCKKCMTEETAYMAVHGGVIYPGVEDMLKRLSDVLPLFIVSNCQSGYLEAFLTYSGFAGFFLDYEYHGRKGLSKEENIRLVMKRHGLENCLYVGDTAHDEQSAKNAGCDFIHASYGFGRAISPDAVIGSPIELAELLNTK